jgi:AbrB family looped-hinge helix DNA binding protein
MATREPVRSDAVLTSKGQVTVPVEMRRRFDLKPGDRLRFEAVGDGEMRVQVRRVRDVFELLANLPPVVGKGPTGRQGVLDATGVGLREKFGARRGKATR